MLNKDRLERGLYWDKAWYLVHGCRPRSEACLHCWAASSANMRQYNPNDKVSSRYTGVIDKETKHFSGHVNIMEEFLDMPTQKTKPLVFSVWDDLFYGDEEDMKWCLERGRDFSPVPIDFIARAFEVMINNPRHVFIVLTKRAKRMMEVTNQIAELFQIDYFPENIIGMVTCENQHWFDIRMTYLLLSAYSKKGISIEPMLGRVDMTGLVFNTVDGVKEGPYLDWVVVGAESGKQYRDTNLDDVRFLRDQCEEWKIPFFLKQLRHANGKMEKLPELDGKVWAQTPFS